MNIFELAREGCRGCDFQSGKLCTPCLALNDIIESGLKPERRVFKTTVKLIKFIGDEMPSVPIIRSIPLSQGNEVEIIIRAKK